MNNNNNKKVCADIWTGMDYTEKWFVFIKNVHKSSQK